MSLIRVFWWLVIMAKWCTFCSLNIFSLLLWSPLNFTYPPPFFLSLILQPVYLSRSLLLLLSHCLLVLWCFNRWINDCFYFHSECLANTCCFAPWEELEIGFGRQRDRKKQKQRQTEKHVLVEGLTAYDTMSCQSALEYICIFKLWLAHQET